MTQSDKGHETALFAEQGNRMTDAELAGMIERHIAMYPAPSPVIGLLAEQWQQIIAALRRPCPYIVTGKEGTSYCSLAERQPERNQCDGCARKLRLGKNGIHYELDGTPVMGCTAHLYERQPESDKVLVPREPTFEMCKAFQGNWEGGWTGNGVRIPSFPERYRAMLAKAEGHHE